MLNDEIKIEKRESIYWKENNLVNNISWGGDNKSHPLCF